MLHTLADVISAVFLVAGAFFTFSAALGLVRFPSTLAKIHAITKPQTIGLMLCVAGAIIRVAGHPDFSINNHSDLGILVLLVIFTLITSPIVGQRVGRSARKEGLYGSDLSINESSTRARIPRKRQDGA